MYAHAVLVILALILAPLGTHAADLVVWWEEGYTSEEDEAVREIIRAFEQASGKQVELTLHSNLDFPDRLAASVEAGQPPDFAFSLRYSSSISPLAFDDRLVDLTDTVDSFLSLFDPDALAWWVLLNEKTGQRKLYALPMGRTTNHIHVWKALLEQAGITLSDIPREWNAFWSFWCDEVQPAVRRATGRDDIWGLGLPMSVEASDTNGQFRQFLHANEADWVTRDGRLVIDDPNVRRKLIDAMDSYTAIYRKGCTPPDAVDWEPLGNNEAFLAQQVVMTPNILLTIPNALKSSRPADYYENTATIEWPINDIHGRQLAIEGGVVRAAVFDNGGNVALATDFVRFLVEKGWLAHYLDFSLEPFLPPMTKLIDQPHWLDPGDPHRMAAAIQALTRPFGNTFDQVTAANWQLRSIDDVWTRAIHRVAADGISPEQAVDEAIARMKQILSE